MHRVPCRSRIRWAGPAVAVLALASAGSVAIAGHGDATLGVSVQRDYMSFNAWTPFATLTYEVYDAPGGALLHAGSGEAGEHGDLFVHLSPFGVDLVEGNLAVATDGLSSVEVVARTVTVDVIETGGVTIEGYAGADDTVFVGVDEFGGQATADDLGRWSIDAGARGWEIREGATVAVFLHEDGTDGGINETSNLAPVLFIHPDDGSGHLAFATPGTTVELEVYDEDGGNLLVSESIPADETGDAWFYNGHDLSIEPGRFIVATDLTTMQRKSHRVRDVWIGALDRGSDVASGGAEPRQTVHLGLFDEDTGDVSVATEADDVGYWEADAAGAGFDIRETTDASAGVEDEQGDWTSVSGADFEHPDVAFHTRHGGVVSRLLRRPVRGYVVDASWIAGVSVTFTPLRGRPVTVEADLVCDPLPRRCDWSASPPLVPPGVYHVMAIGVDSWGNRADLGPSIDVISIP